MKISAIQNSNNRNFKPSFKAGVTEFFSDFDGTFMPHKYRHDVFCRDGAGSPRHEFLKNGKKGFQEYFDDFGEFLDKLRGKGESKLNFTITSGRNRPEYNYYMKRIREDELRVPLPDKLIVRNGGDIFTKRKDIEDFFTSSEKEAFLKSDFTQSKRDSIKEMSNGWDGDEVKKTITNYFTTNGKKDCTVFDADTIGAFYGEGMHFNSKRKMMSPVPENWAALEDNGNIEFNITFPSKNSEKDYATRIKNGLNKELEKGGFNFISKTEKVNEGKEFERIIVRPSLNGASQADGEKITKLFDTKAQVKKIMEGKLNDLVVVAGDDSNDAQMLDLFKYIDLEKGEETISEKNLRKIYDLPLISIYVDNTAQKANGKTVISQTTKDDIRKLEKYFNSDGNVRFIHVVPDNTIGKPQSLNEGLQIAVREYAKRNPEFEKNLSPEMQELLKKSTNDYPIDKSFTENLEKTLGAKLWNPQGKKPMIIVDPPAPKKDFIILACAIAGITAGAVAIFRHIKNKQGTQEK